MSKLQKTFDCRNSAISTRNWFKTLRKTTFWWIHCDENKKRFSSIFRVLNDRKLITMKKSIARWFSSIKLIRLKTWSICWNSYINQTKKKQFFEKLTSNRRFEKNVRDFFSHCDYWITKIFYKRNITKKSTFYRIIENEKWSKKQKENWNQKRSKKNLKWNNIHTRKMQ